MSNKIKITEDEVKQENIGTGKAGTSKIIIECPPDNIPKTTNDSRKLFIIWGIVAIIVISGILLLVVNQRGLIIKNKETVEEWCAKARTQLNQELLKEDSEFKKRIEDAHFTITVTKAEVRSLRATTIDGTTDSQNGNNIRSCTVEIEFTWDGIIQEGGYSILEIIYDIQNNKVIKSKITETNAIINIEDPLFWFNVGWTIGGFL